VCVCVSGEQGQKGGGKKTTTTTTTTTTTQIDHQGRRTLSTGTGWGRA
jgi:hypothetical protein